MRNGVESIKHRKTEGHGGLLLRRSNIAIAFSFKKRDIDYTTIDYTTNLHFCMSREKTENKFINVNKLGHILTHK